MSVRKAAARRRGFPAVSARRRRSRLRQRQNHFPRAAPHRDVEDLRSPSAVWTSPTDPVGRSRRWRAPCRAVLPGDPPSPPASACFITKDCEVRLSTSGVRTTRGDGRGCDAATHPPRPPPPSPGTGSGSTEPRSSSSASRRKALKESAVCSAAIHRFARRLG